MVEASLQFPCEIDVKIFVEVAPDNDELIDTLLAHSLLEEDILVVSQRASKNKRYQAYSCRINAKNKQQMDDLYQHLSLHPRVILAL